MWNSILEENLNFCFAKFVRRKGEDAELNCYSKYRKEENQEFELQV